MTVTSIDIDPNELKQAKKLAGTTSNRETVDLALRTLIAVRRQPAAVERIIGRRFEQDQIDAPTITPAPSAEPRKSAPRPKRTARDKSTVAKNGTVRDKSTGQGKGVVRDKSSGRVTSGVRHQSSAR